MGIGTLLIIVLIIALIASIPAYPYSRSWGYAPSGILGLVILIVVLLWLTGYISF